MSRQANKKTAPPRAPRGSTPERHLLPLSREMKAQAGAEARKQGVSLSEWMRQAIARALPADDKERG